MTWISENNTRRQKNRNTERPGQSTITFCFIKIIRSVTQSVHIASCTIWETYLLCCQFDLSASHISMDAELRFSVLQIPLSINMIKMFIVYHVNLQLILVVCSCTWSVTTVTRWACLVLRIKCMKSFTPSLGDRIGLPVHLIFDWWSWLRTVSRRPFGCFRQCLCWPGSSRKRLFLVRRV